MRQLLTKLAYNSQGVS